MGWQVDLVYFRIGVLYIEPRPKPFLNRTESFDSEEFGVEPRLYHGSPALDHGFGAAVSAVLDRLGDEGMQPNEQI